MAREGKLKAALERYKGVDQKKEGQKRLQKKAEKRKQSKKQDTVDLSALEAAVAAAEKAGDKEGEVEDWETEGSQDDEDAEDSEDGEDGVGLGLNEMEDESVSGSEDEDVFQNGAADDSDQAEDQEDEEDIPLSDIESLASDEKGDVMPHQRLTINNTAALQRSLKSFALPSSLPFSGTQSVTSAEPVHIKDVEDDLNRELEFYKQSLDAVKEARSKLKKEGAPFSRPTDYFAEMVKSEEQMGKVRQKMVDEGARKKASAEARKQRDLKKFGKAVQTAKLQERDKAKRDTMDKIQSLKRKRSQGNDLTTNENDMFDVALEDADKAEKAGGRDAKRAKGRDQGPGQKRLKKNERFGQGGKKKHAKSNDAQSSADTRGYSVGRMKGKGKGPGKGPSKGAQRPGKSKRAKMN